MENLTMLFFIMLCNKMKTRYSFFVHGVVEGQFEQPVYSLDFKVGPNTKVACGSVLIYF
jgi:hypothetical protein